uniref:Uncharacterized protein n=1 Tax=Salix viminalis TaxID=40686 RepID=A0A6N2MC37_SALVM
MGRVIIEWQSQGGETPLYAAAKNRHAGVVTEMLEYMNLETGSVAARNGYDPLHVATEQGHLVSSSLTVQSASKEQGNCGLGPRRCCSQQRRRVHGMAWHSAGYVM